MGEESYSSSSATWEVITSSRVAEADCSPARPHEKKRRGRGWNDAARVRRQPSVAFECRSSVRIPGSTRTVITAAGDGTSAAPRRTATLLPPPPPRVVARARASPHTSSAAATSAW